jgi:hypothetical protein
VYLLPNRIKNGVFIAKINRLALFLEEITDGILGIIETPFTMFVKANCEVFGFKAGGIYNYHCTSNS